MSYGSHVDLHVSHGAWPLVVGHIMLVLDTDGLVEIKEFPFLHFFFVSTYSNGNVIVLLVNTNTWTFAQIDNVQCIGFNMHQVWLKL